MRCLLLILTALFMSSKLFAQPPHQEVVAAVIWAEARGEGFDGMTAVAEVIRNRTTTWKWGATPFEVVTHPKQFSCLNSLGTTKLVAKAKSSFAGDQRAWKYCLALARRIEKGNQNSNLTKGATHYCFSYARWEQSMEFCAKIGRHTFYR